MSNHNFKASYMYSIFSLMWKNQNSHFVEDMIQLCKITYYCLLESGTIPCTFSNNQHGSLSHALKTCFTWCNAVANLKTVHNADHSFTKATRYSIADQIIKQYQFPESLLTSETLNSSDPKCIVAWYGKTVWIMLIHRLSVTCIARTREFKWDEFASVMTTTLLEKEIALCCKCWGKNLHALPLVSIHGLWMNA